MDERSLEKVQHFFSEVIPFHRFLGITVEALEDGMARLRIAFRPEYVGDPFRPALHGGISSTLIDATGGAAVWSTLEMTDRVSTVDLRVDYLRPARLEDLVAEARVLRVGNRVGVVSIRAFHPTTPDETVAEGKGVYNVRRLDDAR